VSLANSNRGKQKKQSSQNKGSGYVQKPVEKSTNTLEKFIRHRKCRPGPKLCKNICTRIVQIFWKVEKYICWYIRGVLVVFHMKNIIPPVPNTKNLKVAVHFHICVLQHPTKFEAEAMRIKKLCQRSKTYLTSVGKLKKSDKKCNKAFWKVSTFCYWLYFCVVPMLHSEIQYRQRFWRKT